MCVWLISVYTFACLRPVSGAHKSGDSFVSRIAGLFVVAAPAT